jgi:hypothetical protein
MISEIKHCRICKSNDLKNILNLGSQPPANSLHKKNEKIKKFPLKVVFCGKCKTSQLSVSLSPKFLFSKYFWVTATSSIAKKHSQKFYNLTSKYIKKNSTVIEIASNDGTFLKPFLKKKHKVLGIDPAKNICKIANLDGIKTIPEFFSEKASVKIKKKYKNIDLIFARNVIPHVKNIHSVVKGISNLASDKSIVAIEFHYSKDILNELQYDSIYHEHLFYFTIKTISNLFSKYNLYPFDVFSSPISGGSLVLIFSKKKNKKKKILKKMEKDEEKDNLNKIAKWKTFANKSKIHAQKFKSDILKSFKINGKLFGYGASARSSTLLNYCKLSNKHIDFIIDQNPLKQNLYTPGTNIPIRSIKDTFNNLVEKNMVLLAWNFKDEIIKIIKKTGFKNKIILPIKKNGNK